MTGRLRDPRFVGRLLFGSMALAGVLLIVLGGTAATEQPLVLLQVPLLASAGLGGLCLVVAGAGLLTAHVGRQLAADERDETDALIAELSLAVAVREAQS